MTTRGRCPYAPDKEYPLLAQCFSQNTMVALSQGKLSGNLLSTLTRHPLVDDDSTLGHWFDAAFGMLTSHYRCEYVYKNTLARKIALGRHSPRTCTFLSEVRVGQHVADAVVLNGTSTVYEIKSEYDSFERLAGQLSAYQRMFDRVVVVCPTAFLKKAEKQVPSWVGLMALTKNMRLSMFREAQSNVEHVVPDFIFPTFRKAEYKSIGDRFGTHVNVPNGELFDVCRRTFNQLSPVEAHTEMLFQLKKRAQWRAPRADVKNWLPESLTANFLASPISPTGTSMLKKCLERSTREWRTIDDRGDLLSVPSSNRTWKKRRRGYASQRRR